MGVSTLAGIPKSSNVASDVKSDTESDYRLNFRISVMINFESMLWEHDEKYR